MKTFKCSLVRDVFITLDDNIYGIHRNTSNILYLMSVFELMVVLFAVFLYYVLRLPLSPLLCFIIVFFDYMCSTVSFKR